MKKILLLLSLSIFLAGCSLPFGKSTPKETERQKLDAAVNAAATPKSIDQVSAEGTVFKSTDPITPTTESEYKSKLTAAWQAYLTAGGAVKFADVTEADRAAQQQKVKDLYDATVSLTVPAADTKVHLEFIMAVSQWQEALQAMVVGAKPEDQQEKISQAQTHLDNVLSTTTWLSTVTP